MKEICNVVKEYKKSIIGIGVFSFLLYSFFMIQQLTNVGDGFWQQSYYLSGGWETGCGRWLLPYVDRIQQGIHVDPLTSILTITIFIIGYIFIVSILDIKNWKVVVLGGCVFLSSPFFSNILSYRFTSVIYALAFLMAVMGAYTCTKVQRVWLQIVLSALFVSLSLGLYQSYLGCYCLILLLYIIKMIVDAEKSIKQIITKIGIFAASTALGCVTYYVTLKIILKVKGIELASYNGADNVSLLNILKSLPESMHKILLICKDYVMGRLMIQNVLDSVYCEMIFHILIITVFAGAVIIYILKAEDKLLRMILFLLCIIAIPFGTNAANIVAPDAGFMPQMGAPLILFSALITEMILQWIADTQICLNKVVCWISIVVCMVNIYGQSMQVLIDHSMMKEGYTATISMANGVVDDLRRKGLLSRDKCYFFIGTPAHNDFFVKSDLYDKANQYAKVGNFWLEQSNMYASYQALFKKVLGINLEVLCDPYESKAYEEFYQAVPCYPEEGYILPFDTVIIKISDP